MDQFDTLLEAFEEAFLDHDRANECGTLASVEDTEKRLSEAREALRAHYAKREG